MMKASQLGTIVFLFLVAGSFLLRAQTNADTTPQPPNPQAAREMRMISFLTPADQEKYAKARARALENNPKLKADGEALMQQAEGVMSSGSAADKQSFVKKMNAHRQNLRQAMLKEDPTLPPIFAEIDKHISEVKAKQLDSVQSSSSPSNGPTASH